MSAVLKKYLLKKLYSKVHHLLKIVTAQCFVTYSSNITNKKINIFIQNCIQILEEDHFITGTEVLNAAYFLRLPLMNSYKQLRIHSWYESPQPSVQ